ncbi:hypothetical protein CFP56_014145 [Quercus suber]|uniref:Inner centromere protein ARK-binding domain-containing protein n=1 Tax=Quercus suber TaxID=58331 RepID=A0AAW0KUC2_QUESU
MSTIEKLLAQIFDRKRSIIDQAKHQTLLFDQNLASKLLIDGIAPPPWLVPPPPHAHSSDPNQFNKEELISGLLFPRPQPVIPYSSSRYSQYNKPVVAGDNCVSQNGLLKEVCVLDKGLHAGDGPSFLPECHAGCAPSADSELGPSAISPQDPRERRISDTYQNPALSLARVQRSKSRQRALELRSSAKAAKSCSRDENIVATFGGGISGSAIASLQSDPVDELVFVNPVETNNVSCVVEEVKIGDCRSKEDGSNICSGRMTRSRSSSQQVSSFNKGNSSYIGREDASVLASSIIKSKENEPSGLAEPSCITDGNSRGRKSKIGDNWSEDIRSNVYHGRITRSRGSSQQPNRMNKLMKLDSSYDKDKVDGVGHSNHVDQSKELVKFSVITDESCGAKQEVDCDSNANFGRILKSRSSSQPSNNVNRITQAQSISKSIKPPQSPRWVGGDAAFQSEEGPQMYDGRGETTTIEKISKPVNSSHALGCKVTRSTSNASSKPPLAQSLNRSEKIDLKEVSGTQIEVLPCTRTSDTVGPERCASTAAGFEIDPDELVAACSGFPGANLDVASLRIGVEVLAMRPPSDYNVLMRPKQLNFDDVEESSLNVVSSPASKTEIQGRSSERSPLTLPDPADIMDKVASVSYQANCNLSQEKTLLEEQEDLRKELEPSFSSEVHVEKTDEAIRSSDGNAVSAVKETYQVPKDATTHTLLESDKIIKEEESSLIDHLSLLQFSCEDLLELPKQVGYNLLHDSVDTRMDVSVENVVMERDGGESTKLVFEDGKPDSDLCGDLKQLTGANFGIVRESGPFKDSDVTLRDSTFELPCAVLVEETEGTLVEQTTNSGISQCQNEDSLGRCISEDKHVYSSKSTEEQILNNGMPSVSFSLGLHDSQPQHKRRKIDFQLTEVLSASPSLREEGLKLIDRDSVSENLDGAEDILKAVFESQHLSLSYEEDAAQSDASKSPVEELQQNGEGHIIEGSEASTRLQVEEVEHSLEGGDGNTPFTFMDDGLRVSYISSLINQVAGDSQSCLAEEAGVADPNSELLDERMQCFVEENPVPLHLEDKLQLGITEYFTNSERTMQEKRNNLEGIENFSYCSVNSPHSQSLDLTGADEIMPDFESFIMQTDDKQPCIAEEGINFDLPNTAIERASVLEQLCRSASMNTPLSCSSTSHQLHRIPSLYQSVPNGLLEGINMKSTLSMNSTGKQLHNGCLSEEVGFAFHGRSYSDCLPTSSGQSTWNIRNPYSSPVGKFWDRITSNTGSSEKQVSSNPELPCIDEENENADEVAETLPEGIFSEVTTSSVKRVPLADITENPNPPASVSEVEIHADRYSLDSVNTEFSFTGTHTGVKQKHGNQNSSRRRYDRKVKEKQSVSIGANGVKRAKESFHSRFSKTKLSGKTSMRNGAPSGREAKTNNIISNITSFIPLVQQKQAAAVVTGKRDIKVKALGAAEAAKRLAEKKDNERKMKKEALKLERARLEQENLRQLELQKRKKEEEKKKKEADMAARKRQREEDERKEKERKRKRVEESRRQQREHEEKLHGEKDERELKSQATDTRTNERKESNDEADKHRNIEKVREDNIRKVSETELRTTSIPTSDIIKASILHEDSKALSGSGNNVKVTSNLDKAIEKDNSFANTNQEQYDISPYKVSDDEEDDDDDDDVPNSKIIPSWASRHCVAKVVFSQQRIDPESIFPLESFCNIDEGKIFSFSSEASEKVARWRMKMHCINLHFFSHLVSEILFRLPRNITVKSLGFGDSFPT